MDYSYVAYNKERKLVRGRVSAPNEETAASLLSRGGFQVVNLKAAMSFVDMDRINAYFNPVNLRDILMLSRQLALLIASGIDVVTSLELLQGQLANRTLRGVVGEIINDIRGGKPLSSAMASHQGVFPQMYHRAIAAGEQGGNLDIILRQMAEFLERSYLTKKKIKSAMAYPTIIMVMAVVVIMILTVFVLPSFVKMFSAFGSNVPPLTKLLINIAKWSGEYGIFAIGVISAAVAAGYIYTRTPVGKYTWDRISLYLPIIGHINLMNELAYCCRIMALLFKIGVSLPDILNMAIHGTTNTYISEALTGVQKELIRGEGLSGPMSRRKVFLPLMVQMIAVGEETGNLDNSLTTVAETYEMDSDELTEMAIGLIQPILIIVISVVVTFVALALLSAMYGIYNQIQ